MTAPRPWSRRRTLLALLAIGVGLVLVAAFVQAIVVGDQSTDYEVYRSAVVSWLSGNGLYDTVVHASNGRDLGFTYPPFAALVLLPSARLPLRAGFLAWTAVQLGLCVVLAAITLLRSPARARWGTVAGWLILALGWLALVLHEPVAQGIAIGQISLALVGLVVVDLMLVPPRWRGLLVGVAGAIKLLPLAFIPYFLVTRQWRAAGNATLSAAAATALGFVLLPSESLRYWTELLWQTGRVGDPDSIRNKSMLGLMQHWGIGGDAQQALWVVAVVVVTVLALRRAWRHHRDGEEFSAMIVVGMLASAVNPVSWPHHLVWLSLAGLALALRPGWPRMVGAALLIGYLTFLPTMPVDPGAPLWERVVGDLAGVALVLFAVLGLPRGHSTSGPVAAASRPEPAG